MANFLNRARMTTATTGTGTITLGLASAGYSSFAESGVADGQRLSYTIEDGSNFEVGRGVYSSSGPTLTREQVLLSKVDGQAAGTSPLSLSGSATVFLTATAEDLRDLGPHFSVKSYGAVGDGITNDHTAIQAAIDAAEASLFIKRVYIPDPSVAYVFNDTVTIPSGVTVFGDNMKGLELSRCKPASGFTDPLFQSDDYGTSRVLRIGLTGLFIDGSSTTLTAIQVNAQESVFRDLTIKNCFTYGIHLGGISSDSDKQALNNQIKDNYLAGIIGTTEFYDGLFIDYFSADNTITGNYIEGSKDAGIRSRGYNNKITNNHIYGVAGTGGGAGIGIYTETSADHDISSNYIELTAAEAIVMAGGGSDVETLAGTVHGNVCRNIDTGDTSNGVIEISGSDVSALTVFGNVVRRDASTSYATPYFVYFNSITPTRAKVFGNEWQANLITTAETNVTLPFSVGALSVTNLTQTGYTDLTEISEPSSPSANVARVFAIDSGGVTRLRKKDSSGNVVPIGLDDVVVFDGVGDDSTDDATALQNALDAADGRTVRLIPGKTYRIATAIVTRGKSWTLDARGARIHVDANVNCLTAYADIDNLQDVSLISGDDVTVDDGSAFAVGDHVRVISEDTPTNARNVASGNTYKSGEPGIIKSIAGDVLTLETSLMHGASMTTTPRIYRIPLEEQVRIIGGEWYYTEGHDATPWTGSMITLYGLIAPRIEGVRITRGYNASIVLVGTQHAYVAAPRIERLTDNTGNSQFGYGVADAGYCTTIVGISGESCRHLVTTNPLVVPAETTDEDQLHKYGHCRGLRVLGGTCMGASNTAFDTHHSTEDVFMTGLYAQNATSVVAVRAQRARIVGIEGRAIDGPLINVFSDNTDTPATEAGWASDVYVDDIFGSADYVLRAHRAVNVHLSNVRASISEWKAFDVIDAQVFLHDDITITIADTASTHAGRGVLDCDDVEASGFTPTIEQVSGRMRVSGSSSSGSATFAAARSDASAITIRNAEFIFPNGSTGPMLITANAGSIDADLKFDISGSGESGMTLTSGSSINAAIQSNDQSKDQLNMRRKAREPLTWLAAGSPSTATIASGVVTAVASFMTIDTESAAASDDLDTINGGVNGDILILRTAASARDVVVKNGTGNISCGSDRTLDTVADRIVLQNTNGTNWVMLSFADNSS